MGALKTPNAAQKPNLVCAGTLKSIGPLQLSSTGSGYQFTKLEIRGSQPDTDARANLMWLPEWFNAEFDTRKLDRSSSFVYEKNVVGAGAQSLLEGLCGDKDTWEQFQDRITALDDYQAVTVDDAIRSFFRELGPTSFGYVLKQERKQDGTDEDGKKVYVRGKYYEVESSFHLTDRNLARLVKVAEKAAVKGGETVQWKFKLDPDRFALSTVLPQVKEPAWVA